MSKSIIPHVEVIPPGHLTRAEWAERITADWRQTLMGIFATGRDLILAKGQLEHGEWLKMIEEDLPFGPRTAQMVMKIASDPRLQNTKYISHLPPAWGTLHQLTRLSDDDFDAAIVDGTICPDMKQKAISARLRSLSKQEDEERVLSLVPAEGKHRALVIDPPWDYEWLSLAGRAAPGYKVMTHEELLALDVAQWAEDNCHLYLWTTNNFMTRAVELMAHWGFQHKTVLTWVKPRWGLGSYFRNNTEHILFGVRGELRTRVDDIATTFEAPLGEHSEKPNIFYDIVRRASYPPYGEVFQRTARPDFSNLFVEKDAA